MTLVDRTNQLAARALRVRHRWGWRRIARELNVSETAVRKWVDHV